MTSAVDPKPFPDNGLCTFEDDDPTKISMGTKAAKKYGEDTENETCEKEVALPLSEGSSSSLSSSKEHMTLQAASLSFLSAPFPTVSSPNTLSTDSNDLHPMLPDLVVSLSTEQADSDTTTDITR